MNKDIKQKAREMFDEKFPEEFFMHDNCECWNETGEPTCYQYEQIKIREFIDQIIDLAIAERDREVVEMIKDNSWDESGRGDLLCEPKTIINLITNSKK